MKLFYIFLGICLLGLAFGSFYYTNMRKDVIGFNAVTSTSTTNLMYIYREYGDVSFKNKTATGYTQVTDEKILIPNYASIKIGDGRGYIILPDNSSISLSSSTEIEINYTPTKVSIMQLYGSTYHRITTLATGNKYEIRTPNTLSTVRGTKLAVTYNPLLKKTYIAVTEHSVEVTQTKDDGVTAKAPVIVQEGSLAEVQSATSTTKIGTTTSQNQGSVTIRANDEVKEITIFIEENKIIDKEYDKSPVEGRKEFLERMIKSLQQQAEQNALEKSLETTSSTSPTTVVKQISRTETLTRAVTQSKTTIPSTPLPKVVTSTKEPTTPTPKIPATTTPSTFTQGSAQTNTPATTVAKTLRELPVSQEELTPTDEAFVDTFYAVYEKYYLVDDAVSYCTKLGTTSSKDIFSALLAVTAKAGLVLPKQAELSSFASDLVSSCADKTMSVKAATFKTRFDTAYPY